MKRFVFIFMIMLSACAEEPANKETPGDACIDPNHWGEIEGCYLIYKPVCGCNNVTYGNDCEAKVAGVTSWTEGSCPK